jgi:phosphonoacetaldehyde hydrolase
MAQQQLQALVLDWAGTVVDFGSFAPTQIFVDAFKKAYDFELSIAQARAPMGLGKWQHIEAIGQIPAVAQAWASRFGHAMTAQDIDHIYQTFMPLQVQRVGDHSDFIPGALDAVAHARGLGLKIGSTTGYPRAVMQVLMQIAAGNGYAPDCTVCADDLQAGSRPGPWMALECVQKLRIEAVWRCVKVDDTVPGLAEGRNAGMWTVGLALSGSPAGWTLDDYQRAGEQERQQVRARVVAEFQSAQPHYVIDTLQDLPAVLDTIEQRLQAGERP